MSLRQINDIASSIDQSIAPSIKNNFVVLYFTNVSEQHSSSDHVDSDHVESGPSVQVHVH